MLARVWAPLWEAHGSEDLLDGVVGLDQGDEANGAFAGMADSIDLECSTGDDHEKARVGDLSERGAISVHVPNLVSVDHTGRSRSARSRHVASAGSSPP